MITRLIHKCIRFIRNTPVLREKIKEIVRPVMTSAVNVDIPEITPLNARCIDDDTPRLNLLVPSVNQEHIFGGIATALSFFETLAGSAGIRKRIITTDTMPDARAKENFNRYTIVSSSTDQGKGDELIGFGDRHGKTIPVGKNDYFMATAWWTAFHAQRIIRRQIDAFGRPAGDLLYFIQDYEPGFYPWSSRYALAESTYRTGLPVTAVFNSSMLYTFFKDRQYRFSRTYEFEPVLNPSLARGLAQVAGVKKKKQILIYGRPSVDRNAFSLIVSALKEWVWRKRAAGKWELISAGESHPDIDLGNGMRIRSVGKLTLDKYMSMLAESGIGISLMVSPHPSYPPMEMAVFGMGVISNTYANKALSRWHDNIISIDLSIDDLVKAIDASCLRLEADPACFLEGKLHKKNYLNPAAQFDFLDELSENLFTRQARARN